MDKQQSVSVQPGDCSQPSLWRLHQNKTKTWVGNGSCWGWQNAVSWLSALLGNKRQKISSLHTSFIKALSHAFNLIGYRVLASYLLITLDGQFDKSHPEVIWTHYRQAVKYTTINLTDSNVEMVSNTWPSGQLAHNIVDNDYSLSYEGHCFSTTIDFYAPLK